MKLILLLSSFYMATICHDISIATFRIYEEDRNIMLNISIDLADLCTELTLDHKNINNTIVENYINEHLIIQIETNKLSFALSDLNIIQDHIKISGQLAGNYEHLKSIVISNNILLSKSDQSNIIQLELNNQNRDFRMHHGRRIIEVAY